jgi:hypothetical protein
VDTAVFSVERVTFGYRGADIDPVASQRRGDVGGAEPVDLGGDEGAALRAKVVGADARELGELVAQPLPEVPGALGDRINPDRAAAGAV